MSLYIYRSLLRDKKLDPSVVLINGYGDLLVKTGCVDSFSSLEIRHPRKTVFQITDTRGYFILGHGIAQQIGNIHFPRITQPKLTQSLKAYVHLTAILAKAPIQKDTGRLGQDLGDPNIQLLGGTVHINRKKCNLPIARDYIPEECNGVMMPSVQ